MESGTKNLFCYTTAALSAGLQEKGVDATTPVVVPAQPGLPPMTGETLNQDHGSSLPVRSLGIPPSSWKPPSHILSQGQGRRSQLRGITV